MPAEEPRPETRTLRPAFSCWNSSPDCSAMGSSVVEPVTMSCSARPDFAAAAGQREHEQQPWRGSEPLGTRKDAGERPRDDPSRRPRRDTRRTGRWSRRCTSRDERCRTARLLPVKAGGHDGVEVESPRCGPRKCTKRVNELRHDFGTHLVVARADVRTDVRAHARRRRSRRPPRGEPPPFRAARRARRATPRGPPRPPGRGRRGRPGRSPRSTAAAARRPPR